MLYVPRGRMLLLTEKQHPKAGTSWCPDSLDLHREVQGTGQHRLLSYPGPTRSKYFHIPPGDVKKSPLRWEGRTGSSSSSSPRKDQCSLQPSRLMRSGLGLGCTSSPQTKHLPKKPKHHKEATEAQSRAGPLRCRSPPL